MEEEALVLNKIHPSAVLIGDVDMGHGNYIGPNATIIGPVVMGNDNFVGAQAVVGAPPQDDLKSVQDHAAIMEGKAQGRPTRLGNGNVLREFVTVHRGISRSTTIANDNYLMAYAHVPHDCEIGSSCKLTNAVQMGGYTSVLDGAYVGLSAIVHQFTVVGGLSIVGMGAVVSRDVLPASKAVGAPARTVGLNRTAVMRVGVSTTDWWTAFAEAPESPLELPDAIRSARDTWISARHRRDELKARVSEVRAHAWESRLKDGSE
jgi:UDP-N-acetylglucosamine acyltransferase